MSFQNCSSVTEFEQLERIAIFAYRVCHPLSEILPADRDSQEKLVEVLAPAIKHAEFLLSKEFLTREVMLSDKDLLDGWSSAPDQLAWLMVHEQLSDYFIRFAIRRRECSPFFVHHLPKSCGTSVNQALNQLGYFVGYPNKTHEVMLASYGQLGFASQLIQLSDIFNPDRLYIGGHYNLPDKIRELGLFGDCRGITLCREPFGIISSALRYIWTMIEMGDTSTAERYRVSGLLPTELIRLRARSGEDASADSAMAEILRCILNAEQFRSEYGDIYAKYFFNHEIDREDILLEYLRECGTIFPVLDLKRDWPTAMTHLQVECDLPCMNVSSISNDIVARTLGGVAAFRDQIKPLVMRSVAIYETLGKLQSQCGPPPAWHP